MLRRDFIKNLSIAGAAVAVPLPALSLPGTKYGVMIDFFRLYAVSETFFDKPVLYKNHEKALQDLKAGKIDCLITSPFFLVKSHPEFSLFSHFPTDLSHEQKSNWVKQNYPVVKSHYNKLELDSHLVDLMPSLFVRATNLSPEKLAASRPHELKIAANGNRKHWYKQVGYQVVGNRLIDRQGYQIEMLSRGTLSVTEASTPLLLLESISENHKNMVPLSFYKKTHLILDNDSRRGLPMEFIMRPGATDAKVQSMKNQLQGFIAKQAEAQLNSLKLLKSIFNEELIEGLPQSDIKQLESCKNLYLETLAGLNETSSVLVDDYRRFSKA